MTDQQILIAARAGDTHDDSTGEKEGTLTVLLVDDARSTRRFLRGVLEACDGFTVVGEAEDGAVAVDVAAALQPDVVLLDVSMPVADGLSALSGLRTAAPDAAVVILSNQDPKSAGPLLAAGAVAFVRKGLDPFDLVEELSRILQPRMIIAGSMADEQVVAPRALPGRSASDDPAPAPRAQHRAVICDDNAMTRRLIAQVLAACNVRVVAESDVVPVLQQLIEVAKPELVVLDLWLEGTPGTAALPDIRKASPETRVIVYSAHEEWKHEMLAAGATAFVAKPHFDQLETAIRLLTTM